MDELEVYSRVGDEGFRRLIAAFYRQVPEDGVASAVYTDTNYLKTYYSLFVRL